METGKKENKQLAPKGEEDVDEYIYSCADNVVSSTECTGLIPTPPANEQEAQAFRTERCFVATCKRCCGNDKIANRSEVKEREISLAAEKT